MAQHDFTIDNQAFPATRSDINSALQALASLSSGASSPSTTFAYQLWVNTTSDPNILNIRNSANNAWIEIGEVNQASAAFILTAYAYLQAGAAATPSFSFDDDRDTGMYRAAANIIGFATNGTVRVRINDSGQSEFSSGTAALPAISIIGDVNTGMLFPAADTVAVSTGGTERMRINSSGQTEFGAGTAALPAISTTGDTNTGVFYPAADTVGIVTGGTERMRINSSGQAEFTAGTAALPAIATTGDTNTGIFFPAADTIAFTEGGVESMRIDSSGYTQGTVNGLSAGRIPAMQYYRLNSAVVGTNVNTAQSVFSVGVTLVGSTQYEFEGVYLFTKIVGATAHTIGTGFGGTATILNIGYSGQGSVSSANPNTSSNYGDLLATSVTPAAITGSIGNSTTYAIIKVKGTVSINVGGTFIPHYILSVAPGGAYTTNIGSYFRIFPLAASGAAVNIGSWA